jgi:C4-dicarboxylate transporter DctM subunit
LGALCAAGTLGIIIPPSIPLILYGVMTQTSIADLFIAGIGPALVLTSLMAAYAITVNFKRPRGRYEIRRIGRAFLRSVFALLTPVIILGGIYSGYFTPTESAAVAVFTALIVELFIHRDMTFSHLYEVVGDTAKLMGSLFPLLAFATSLNIFMTYQQVPATLVEMLTGAVESKWAFILAVNFLLLIVGFIVDIGSAILILSPLLQPMATSPEYGMDPVHFGIMMIVNLEIGYLTPPLGLNLIVAMGAFKEDFWTICKAVVPFIFLMLLGLAVVIVFPQLSLFLLR